MKGIEILEKHPLVAKLAKAWFLKKMIESMSSSEITDDFKKYLEEKSIHFEQIGNLIDVNPRILFDLFDEHKIYINIIRVFDTFQSSIVDSDKLGEFKIRNQAELEAIILAFSILEEQLFVGKERPESNALDYPESQE